MPKYNFEQYKSIFNGAIKKYEGNDFFKNLIGKIGRPVFPSAPRNVAIIGIRREGKETKFRENTADDTISLVRIDSDGLPEVWEYTGTTESGYFDEVINPLGDFKMSPGFYFFKHGLHKGKYPCLVQACEVLGERAKKGQAYNELDEQTWQITDGTLHIHAGIKNLDRVGNWSAGCTVIAGGWEGIAWAQFFKYCKMATNTPIPYVLVNESDIPELLDAAGGNGSNGSGAAESAPDEPGVSIPAAQAAPQPQPAPQPAHEAAHPAAASAGGMRFDRTIFWEQYRAGLARFGERVQAEEVPHVNNILDRAERDPRIKSVSQLAYMMTTSRWETDRYRALYERGGDAYLSQYQGKGGNTRPGDYKRYRGTGYVHLTFRDNFRNAGVKLGAPLEEKPELAADPHWAYEIMVRGHLEGWFTGKKLGDYVNDTKKDFRGARRVINPGELNIADKALTLAAGSRTKRQNQCIEALDTQIKWAGMIEKCLRAAQVESAPAPSAAGAHDDVEDGGRELKPEPAFTEQPQPQETGLMTVAPTGMSLAEQGLSPTTIGMPQTSAAPPTETKRGSFIQASTGSVKRMWATVMGGAAAAVAGIKGFVEGNPMLSAVIIIATMAAVIWLVTWYIHVQRDLDKKRMEMAADPSKNNVR